MPPAVTVKNRDGSSAKVFEWRMHLQDIGGWKKLVESKEGKIGRIPEIVVDGCDIIRIKWIWNYYRVI